MTPSTINPRYHFSILSMIGFHLDWASTLTQRHGLLAWNLYQKKETFVGPSHAIDGRRFRGTIGSLSHSGFRQCCNEALRHE